MVTFQWDQFGWLKSVKTPKGTFKVWFELELVDFIPKGKRKPVMTKHFGTSIGNSKADDIYMTVIRLMAEVNETT